MALSMVRGDSKDIPIVILGSPVPVTGTWTWNGSLVVLSSNTGGVVAGDWIRLPVSTGATPNALFKVASIAANVSATITNPNNYSIPSSQGLTTTEKASPVDVTGAVIKFSVKEYLGQPNAAAVIFKASYDAAEIEITDAAAGEATIKILTDDTTECEVGSFPFDVELTRQGAAVSTTGTATMTLASGVVVFSVLADVTAARVGDVLVPAGLSGNDVPVTITETPATTGSTLGVSEVATDYAGFVAEAAVAFTLFRGDRKTPSGLRGTFTVEADATL